MSHVATVWAWKQKTGSPMRKLVLLQLADASDKLGRSRYSVHKMAKQAETAERTVQRHISGLVEIGLVEVVRQGGRVKGRNLASVYRLRYEFDGAVDALLEDDELVTLGRQRVTPKPVGGVTESGTGVSQSPAGGVTESPFPGNRYPVKDIPVNPDAGIPKDKTASPAKSESESNDWMFLNEVAKAFNDNLPAHTKAKIPQPFAHNRITRIREIVAEHARFAKADAWEWYFSGINELEFWNGKTEGKKFKRNIDYFLKPDTFINMYEEVESLAEDVLS